MVFLITIVGFVIAQDVWQDGFTAAGLEWSVLAMHLGAVWSQYPRVKAAVKKDTYRVWAPPFFRCCCRRYAEPSDGSIFCPPRNYFVDQQPCRHSIESTSSMASEPSVRELE